MGRRERNALLLGPETQTQFVLIDDAKRKEAADAHGLCVIGTIGAIKLAVRDALVDAADVAIKLKGAGFCATPRRLALL